MKVCPKCKSTYNDEFSFCKKCGIALEGFRKSTQSVRPNSPEKKDSSNNILLIFVAIFVIALGCVGIYHFYGKMQALENQVQKQKIVINNNNRDLESQKSTLEDQKQKIQDLESAVEEAGGQSHSLPASSSGLALSYTKSNVIRDSAVVGAVHSSADVENSYVHGAWLTTDGKIQSCWSEGVPGWGIGEFITISFDDVYEVSGFNIWTGHQKSQDLFHKNGRPAAIRVVANGINQFYQLRDSMGSQQIRFPYPVRTDSVKIIIADVFKGYKYQDTCIAEVGFF